MVTRRKNEGSNEIKRERSWCSVKKLTLTRNLVKARRGIKNEEEGREWTKGESRVEFLLGCEKTVKSGRACFIFVTLHEPTNAIHNLLFSFFSSRRLDLEERSGYAGETFPFPGNPEEEEAIG